MSGYPFGVLFKGSEKLSVKFKGYEIFPEDVKGSEISNVFDANFNENKIKPLNFWKVHSQ